MPKLPPLLAALLLLAVPLLTGCEPDGPVPNTTASPTPTPTPAPFTGPAWHVSAENGDDKNDGRGEATAFRTLAKAATVVQPGDTVLIGNGIYVNDKPDGNVVTIARSGKPDAWITWRPRPGHKPEVRPTGWGGIVVTGSYNILDGLTVIGNNDGIVLLEAIEDLKNPKANPKFNTNGIFFNGRLNGPDAKPHHLIVRNCTVAKCPGGGVTGIEIDYFTVEDCLIYENAWFMRYGGSGITTLNNWAHDDAPGYHVVIQRNKVWANRTYVNWEKVGKLSDGNGILLDVTDQEAAGATNPNADAAVTGTPKPPAPALNPDADPAVTPPATAATPTATATPTPATPAATPKPPRPEWKGRALIANNLSAYNGGSGIHVFRTRGVDIVNNTTYWNGRNVGYPELFSNRSEDIVILNNVIVPRPGGKVTSNSRNKNNRWDFNLYPVKQEAASKPEHIVTGPKDVVADPMFVKVAADLREADFRLAPGSPARDSGSAGHRPARRQTPGGRRP